MSVSLANGAKVWAKGYGYLNVNGDKIKCLYFDHQNAKNLISVNQLMDKKYVVIFYNHKAIAIKEDNLDFDIEEVTTLHHINSINLDNQEISISGPTSKSYYPNYISTTHLRIQWKG